MKNYLKLLTITVIAFVMMIGINVNAAVKVGYDLYSDGSSINIFIPIHKTDANKKPLEGAIFTLKDFNNTISYSSSYEGDGDYLIEVNDGFGPKEASQREDFDQEMRINDEYSDDDTLMKILDIIPSKYSDVIRNAQNREDLYDMLDLPLIKFHDGDNGYFVAFYIPLKVEESKVPTGYKAKNIIVPAIVYLSLYDEQGYGYLSINISYTPGYSNSPFGFEGIPAYFEYSDGVDYAALFDKLNNKIAKSSPENLLDIFEDNGAIIDDNCEMKTPVLKPEPKREDLEERFSDDIEENLCPINLIDEKEDIIVNPETAGTIGIVTLLVIISFVLIINRRKINNN